MRVSRIGLVAGLFLAAVLLSARPADAQAVFYYRGVHAVPSAYGGFCHLGVRHFHSYKPEDTKVFRYDDNTYVFIGDPTAHGWDGPRVAFYGHHPIAPGWGGGWCFIGGPHYHHYATYGTSWRWHGGAYYWAGAWTDPWYLRYRTVYAPIFANYYVGRVGYVRPVIYAAPPRLYAGPRVTVPVAAWRGPTMRVPVGGPRVGVGVRPGMRPGMGPGVRPGMGGPGMRPAMGPGVRPGVGPGPGMGKVAPSARPGMAPAHMSKGMSGAGMSKGMPHGPGPGAKAGMQPTRPTVNPATAGRGGLTKPASPAAGLGSHGQRNFQPPKQPAPRPNNQNRPPQQPRLSPSARPAAAAARPAAPRPAPAPIRSGGGGGGRRP